MNEGSINFYQEKYKEATSRRDEILNLTRDLRIKNLDHIRSFLFNLVVISSAAIVAIFPVVLKDLNYFKNPIFAIIGLAILVLMNLVGLFYLSVLLIRENNNLSKADEFHNKAIEKTLADIDKGLVEKTDPAAWFTNHIKLLEDISKEENNLRSEQELKGFAKWFDGNFLSLLVYSMIIGVVFIVISLIPFKIVSDEIFWLCFPMK